MGTHLRNAASDADRWMLCPGSLRLDGQLPPQPETEWQREGRLAHRAYELMLRAGAFAFSDVSTHADLADVTAEMAEQVEWAVDTTYEMVDQAGDTCTFESELRGDLEWAGLPECGGTTDARIFGNRTLWIIDLKYGWKRVDAVANRQMMIYALMQGDLLTLVDRIKMVILQPKVSREAAEWEITPSALKEWALGELLSGYTHTFDPQAPLHPSDEACHWCPANGICAVSFTRSVDKVEEIRNLPVDVIPLNQIAPVLEYESEAKAFFAALWKRAAEFEANGIRVPGMKWVAKNTKYVFPESAIPVLQKNVPQDVLYDKKVKSPAQLAKAGYKAIADSMKMRPEKKTLVLETDKRPPIEPGTSADLFGDVEGE